MWTGLVGRSGLTKQSHAKRSAVWFCDPACRRTATDCEGSDQFLNNDCDLSHF